MPELPEVNTFKIYFEKTALRQRIKKTVVHDDKIFRNISGGDFEKKLTGRTFIDTYRRGKYMFGKLDNNKYVQFHFGMTCDFKYYSDIADKPRHERFVFIFENGFRLGFDCPRKFARINYIENLDEYIARINLGTDALEISEAEFLKKIKNKKGTLKGFLLNQKNIAGMGNLYVDETCYQCRIHPASRLDKIPLKKKKEIFDKMQNILQRALDERPHYKGYPPDWFWQWREEGKLAPDGKSKVEKTEVAGRTTYFAKGWQRLY
ncbi:MAG TPA: DNA-(apurinic or apyrimidinic site) lyase [Bacteroidetes bacterium]|nr:DNA-(apurinic or apyrimidinic site) lyase [Bacteroidota bacterium]